MSKKNENSSIPFDGKDNAALVRVMKEMKEKRDDETEAQFLREMKKAKFITPAIIRDQNANGGKNISFLMLRDQKGKMFIPAFTGMEELKKHNHGESVQVVGCTFAQYIEMFTQEENNAEGLVIDPAGSNVILSKELMKELNGTKIRMSDLKVHPKELLDVLRSFFDKEGTVEKAYMLAMQKGIDSGFLLVVDNSFPDGISEEELKPLMQDLYDRIGEEIKSALAEFKKEYPEYADITFSITAYNGDLGRTAAENREPFYTR